MNFYKNKYLKYKQKYLELIGGSIDLDIVTASALQVTFIENDVNKDNITKLYLKLQGIKSRSYNNLKEQKPGLESGLGQGQVEERGQGQVEERGRWQRRGQIEERGRWRGRGQGQGQVGDRGQGRGRGRARAQGNETGYNRQAPEQEQNPGSEQVQVQKQDKRPVRGPESEKSYFETKQEKDTENFKYMGLPAWGAVDPMKYLPQPSNKIHHNNKTLGHYIWDADPTIMTHLRDHCKTESDGKIIYYPDVQNLRFIPKKELPKSVLDDVQELINLCYPTRHNEADDDSYPYNRLNLLQKSLAKGYYYDYSREIINNNSIESLRLMKEMQKKRPDNSLKKLKALLLNSERTCSNAHSVQGNTVTTQPYMPVLFEDLFIGISYNSQEESYMDNKQLLYTSTPHISKYFNNNKIIVSPFVQPHLNMGLLSYNTKTNKAITQCIFTHSPLIFPLRIILYLSLLAITYINLYEDIKFYDYIGFF